MDWAISREVPNRKTFNDYPKGVHNKLMVVEVAGIFIYQQIVKSGDDNF